MEDRYAESIGGRSLHPDPVELLRSFQWTQQLVKKLVRDPALADEVQQEVWVRALERFGDAIPGRAWLGGTLRSVAFRVRRSRERRRLHESRREGPGESESAAEVILRSEAQQRVASAVAQLPDELRVALLLHFQEGLSLAEVARQQGGSKSSAGERVQRGVAVLRAELKSDRDGWRACCLLALPFGASSAVPVSAIQAQSASGGTSAAATSTALLGLTMKKTIICVVVLALASLAVWSAAELGRGHSSPDLDVDGAALGALPEVGTVPAGPRLQRPDGIPPGRATVALDRASAADEPVYRLVGRIVEATGAAIPGAVFAARAGTGGWQREIVAGEDGSFELSMTAEDLRALRQDDIDLEASGGDFRTLWESFIWGSGIGDLEAPALGEVEDLGLIVLHPAGVLEGVARGSAGEPIHGGILRYHEVDPRRPGSRSSYDGTLRSVTTDPEGRFRVPNVGRVDIALSIFHPGYRHEAPMTACRAVHGKVTGPVLLSGIAAEFITGRVVDTAGQPLEGVRVNGAGRNGARIDAVSSDADGRFRAALRREIPSLVTAYLAGWTTIGPPLDDVTGGADLLIQMEREAPRAAYSVLVVDAASGEPIWAAGALVRPVQESGADVLPQPRRIVQPVEGLPVDLVPGEDELVVGAKGYSPRLVFTDELTDSHTTITVGLEPALGVRGQLVENGRPVAGAIVELVTREPVVADPRESTLGGVTERLPRLAYDDPVITGSSGYSSEYVMGIDGVAPPMLREWERPQYRRRTDASGRFHFHRVEEKSLGLRVALEGQPMQWVQACEIDNGDLDLGLIEIERSPGASIAGIVESAWPFDPEQYVVELKGTDQEVALDSEGRFHLGNIAAGHAYLRVALGDDRRHADFEDIPVFCLTLSPGEERSVVLSLDPYAPAALELTVTVGGKPPVKNCYVLALPVDEPSRPNDLHCDIEGKRLTLSTRALGSCELSMSQASERRGWTMLALPGPVFEFSPGAVVARTVDIPAGWVELSVPVGHPVREYSHVDLRLREGTRKVEVFGSRLWGKGEVDSGQTRTVHTAPIPPGTYHVTVHPSRWRYEGEGATTLAEFRVTVANGDVASAALD